MIPRRSPRRRYDRFRMNRNWPLWGNLLFAGLEDGRFAGSITMRDRSLYGRDGTLNGYTGAGDTPADRWQWDGTLGWWVLGYDGSGDYVETGQKFTANVFSVSVWAYADFAYNIATSIYPSMIGALNDAGTVGWNLYYGSTNDKWTFYVAKASGGHHFCQSAQITSDVLLGRGTWQHFCGVCYGSSSALFINGVSAGTGSGGTTATTSTSTVRIGDNNDFSGVAGDWTGKLTDPMVFDRALSNSEIADLARPYNTDLRVGRVPGLLPVRTWFPAAAAGGGAKRRRLLIAGVPR